MFDAIDTGVSNEMADKVGVIMKELALNIQLTSSTHLLQIAAKGFNQYLVYKVVGDKLKY